jgi:diguanylate cyclase (GGDEF)-like protein
VLLWLHWPVLVAFGAWRGRTLAHALVDLLPVLVLAVLASAPRIGRPARSIAGAAGLVTCSALLVHLWDGASVAHLHVFVIMPLLTLYQDWTPFLVATGYAILHRGLLAAVEPGSIYDQPAAAAASGRWALAHSGFVLAAAAASMASWRASERLPTDPLTGLNTRLVLHDRIAAALGRRRPDAVVAVMFVDVDRFKRVNDTLGHGAGDRLIATLAERFRACLRPLDSAVRFGGDEFVAVCEGIADAGEADAIAERIGAALREPCRIDGHELVLSVSVGIAVADAPGAAPEALVRDADTAMYRAKAAGRDRHVRFDGAMRAELLAEVALEHDLRGALDRDEFELLYQPLLDLRTGWIHGVEALLRWHHPARGTVSPAEFIPVAEETREIVAIGRWLLREACRQLSEWRLNGMGADVQMNVNLSPRQLDDPLLLATIESALQETGIEASDLCLEVTEGLLLEDLDRGAEVLIAIRALGVRLALDDFGTGRSSVGHLRRLELDALKIDRSFIRDLARKPEVEPLVLAMVAMGHALGLEVVGEGVETPEQLDAIRSLGCDAAQGYILARPRPGAVVGPVLDQPSGAVALLEFLA